MKRPQLSIATKLYVIFALLATITTGLAALLAVNASNLEGAASTTAWLMTALGSLAVLLALAGALTIWRAVARPLRRIAQITESVAAGAIQQAVPYADRQDEVG